MVMAGQYFVDQVLNSTVNDTPWQHQLVRNSLPTDVFARLRQQCEQFLHHEYTDEEMAKSGIDRKFISPDQFKDYGIDLYDEIRDVAQKVLDNAHQLTKGLYSNPRWYDRLTVYAHIAVVPSIDHIVNKIHEEEAQKMWSSVTYIAPDQNLGTLMYTAKDESTLMAEAEWRPNNSFIFCGQKGVTWHKYQSSGVPRVSFNMFLLDATRKKYLVSNC